jgi:adenine-specific DNA-methyltransferase
MANTRKTARKTVSALRHEDASRRNIPTAEYESVMDEHDLDPLAVAYARRNPDLDPQLVWRGKDIQDWSDLVVPAPPLFIQEKVHPKVLVDDLMRTSTNVDNNFEQIDLFADFNGLSDEAARTEFYEHDANWTNRMILGDSLQVMASLAQREGLREQVQCIYFDPPYGIKFNSNFQWSTTTRDVKDGKAAHITREPEQVRAFRDTWRDGIHSYLTYLRDRLTVARDLLRPSGSIFVQIGDENAHRVRVLMDEVFGSDNCVSVIHFQTTTGQAADILPRTGDYILWYARSRAALKHRPLYRDKDLSTLASYTSAMAVADGSVRKLSTPEKRGSVEVTADWRVFSAQNLRSQDAGSPDTRKFVLFGREFDCGPNHHWKTNPVPGLERLARAGRLQINGATPNYIRFVDDFPVTELTDRWDDTAIAGFSGDKKRYVVETPIKVVQRCILLATDPGDLVLDPTCGSGTSAVAAELWGRRWVTIDTSRVAMALARARLMGARFPFYKLADATTASESMDSDSPTPSNLRRGTSGVRQGFEYKRVPHVTLKAIANSSEIDVVWEKWQETLEPLRLRLNEAVGERWDEWTVPREADSEMSDVARSLHTEWWQARRARQRETDEIIARHAEFEDLYDRPNEDKRIVRVSGPFTVESLSPHRLVSFDENGDLVGAGGTGWANGGEDFATMVLENLATTGVQQAHKEDKLDFVSVSPWPGKLICGEGVYREGGEDSAEKRAGIFVGPEFGTVSRADLVEAAREAGDAGFDTLVACAFNYEAHASEFNQLGRIPVLKARMNADLHMADDLKNTGKGNLFVIFGEPDIAVLDASGDQAAGGQIQVQINGIDVFDPSTGEIRSDGADGIACWFVDTDYNEESFFVRQAYFLGANDPYKALKTTMKAEIDHDAWASLHSDTSRPFDRPASGRIAVKVINHLGDEAMKVIRVA